MSRQTKNAVKLSVLNIVKENKNVLFGKLTGSICKNEKQAAWEKVLQQAKAVQLASVDKKWTFARDSLFGLWKSRTLVRE